MNLIDVPNYHKIIETLPAGFFMLKADGSLVQTNSNYLNMTGYTKKSLAQLTITDIEVGTDKYGNNAKLLLSKINTGHFECSYETRHRCADGKKISVEIKASYAPDICPYILVFIRDISLYKRAQSRITIVEKIFNNSTEAIVVTDPKGIIKLVNKAFTDISGYSAKEAIGKTPAILNSGRQDKAFYQAFWHALQTTGTWSGEIWNKRKNGEIYPEWLNIISVTNSHGEISHYISQFIDISELKKSQSKQLFQIYHDPLTLLPNRRLLFERLENLCKLNANYVSDFALIFCDIDRFKSVNDSLGHNVGDEVLKAVATRIQQALRGSDTIARSGGDEFIIVIEGAKDVNNIERIAAQILSLFETPFTTKHGDFHLTCSLGISQYPEDSTDVRELISFADLAMYKVKMAGGNNFCTFDKKQKDAVRHKIELENSIHTAIQEQHFEVWYQPQINCQTREVYGIECLLRWQHPEHGLIAPNLFIPIAEDTGLIKQIGLFVLKSACKQLRKWQINNYFNGVMAVNVSLRQFENNNLFEQVREVLTREMVAGSSLEIEVTESLFSNGDNATTEILHQLRTLDIKIAIDDFGTGYSSLSRLKQLPVNNLKIDKSFVDHITTSAEDVEIVKAILLMANSFGLDTIAEGVETIEQAEVLASLGCANHQGYLYSKPLPAEQFERWLLEYQQHQDDASFNI
ncbi:EAL domain-containing protein [Thalassotalea sp. PLHSN55]|uniref:putative bifunctional diguanylate cyclase/phosphodiesterase n=1 Tax=Thalassotalea sp. PLHSN55 TaxID=3435888 RepID=UPI003F85C302